MKILVAAIILIFTGCTSSTEIKRIEERQIKLEAKIDSLEKQVKIMVSTDSVFLEMLKPQPGTLLYEVHQGK